LIGARVHFIDFVYKGSSLENIIAYIKQNLFAFTITYVLNKIKKDKPNSQHAQRHEKYVEYRRNCESILRSRFIEKGGVIKRNVPYYMTIEHSPWLSTWFENSAFIKIPIEEFDIKTLSFTYGDSMPTFSQAIVNKKEYHNQLYTYDEILKIIDKYGLPQNWNDDGKYGYERYIEVHIWNDFPINKYITDVNGLFQIRQNIQRNN